MKAIDISKGINYFLDNNDYNLLKNYFIKCSHEKNDRELNLFFLDYEFLLEKLKNNI